MRAIFLNSLTEAKLFEASDGLNMGDVVIPIGPDARYYAEKKGWKTLLIKDFLDKESNEEGRVAAEKAIYGMAEKINAYYRADKSFPPVSIGNYCLFDLYIIIGQVLFTDQLVGAVSEQYSITVFENQAIANKVTLGIRPHPDLLVATAARKLKAGKANIIPYRSDPESDKLSLKRRLRRFVPSWFIDIIYKFLWCKELVKRPSLWAKKRKKVLVLGGMFDWKPVVFGPEFMARFVPTFRSSSDYPVKVGSDGSAQKLAELIAETVFPGRIDAYDFKRLARQIQAVAEHISENSQQLDRFARSHEALLAAVFVTPSQKIIAERVAKGGKPVICYQHGAMGTGWDPFIKIVELVNTTHYFAYGDGVASVHESFIGSTRLKEVAVVGSTLKKIKYDGGNLIVYATGKWFKTARPYILDTPDPDGRLFEAQRAIISYLEKYAERNPEDRVIIKANNTDFFNSIPFETNIEVDYASKFIKLLQNARLVILDTPGTTCIEAASLPVPLFVLSGRVPWFEEPMRMLKKRAVVESKVDNLVTKLEEYETGGVYSADLESREFSDSYAGVRDSGEAVDEVMQNLTRITNGH